MDGKVITVQQPPPVSAGADYTPLFGSSSDVFANKMYMVSGAGIPVYHTSSCMANAPCAAFPPEPGSGNKPFYWSYNGYSIIASSIYQVQQAEQTMVSNPPPENMQNVFTSVFFKSNADGTVYTLGQTLNESICTVWGGEDGHTCVSGQYDPQSFTYDKAGLLSYWSVGLGVAPVGGTDLSQVYPQLSPESLATPLDPNTLAQITNQTWQQAASQPGYQGLPYPVTQPVSYPDVQPWAQENPSLVPNVGDLFSPAADPGTQVQISPTVQPGTSTGTNPGGSTGTDPSTGTSGNVNVVNTPNVNVVNPVKVDLGSDPQTGSPSLENIPTISMILSPIMNLFPDLKAWAVPEHTAVCPTPKLDVFGKTFTMSVHCDLAEQHRSAISTIFLAVFALAALFIVLGA
ncbi:hypothetical protein BG57_33075 [Caballeronia grimmiae]|uniref:Uncharacterized protein n=1 Tax=Caballeronia grimmiae TaxID=1071679 RepID=A0A069N945_9BURK|nr:hypothetical protein BG57_33075 [Caballeronia grimmiae]